MFTKAYLIPSERPPTELAIKRALLTFHQVMLAHLDDRELIEAQAFPTANDLMPMGLISMNMGPVRPLGKVPGYDDQYQPKMEALREAEE